MKARKKVKVKDQETPTPTLTIHPSTLGVSCPRFHWLYGRKERPQTYFEDATEAGLTFEQAIFSALRDKEDVFWVDKKEYRIPAELQGRKWEVQKEIEDKFTYKTHEIRVHGYADLYCPDENWIVDVKSSYDTSSTRWRWQLGAYSMPFWTNYTPPRVSVYFARWGIVADIEPLHPQEVRNHIKHIVSFILADSEPKGRGGVACWFCPYSPSCPESPNVSETPEELLREVVKLEAKVRALKANLKAQVSVVGSVATEDAKAEFVPVTSLDVDPMMLYNTLTTMGLDPFGGGYFVPDRRKVLRLARSNSDIQALVLLKASGTRFAIKKTGVPEDKEKEEEENNE